MQHTYLSATLGADGGPRPKGQELALRPVADMNPGNRRNLGTVKGTKLWDT